MILLGALLCIFLCIYGCNSATTTPTQTSLSPVLTGNCINATSTFAAYVTHTTPEFVTTTPLIDGQWRVSIYSTSGAYTDNYYYLTLGCQSDSLTCCPPEAISTSAHTFIGNDITTTYFSVRPVTACPADYVTLVDRGVRVDATRAFSIKPTTLCCPSGWKIWPTAFPKPGDTDTNPCYQPWPKSVQGETVYVPAVETPAIPGTLTTLDYSKSAAVTYISGPYTMGVALGVRLTRSYKLEIEKARGSRFGPGKIVAIVVPITCLLLGTAIVYSCYRRREKKKAQRKKIEGEEKGPRMPELGEGLAHELEPGAKPKSPRETAPDATEVDGNDLHELDNSAVLNAPWSNGPWHELPDHNLRELDSNVPAAYEVSAADPKPTMTTSGRV